MFCNINSSDHYYRFLYGENMEGYGQVGYGEELKPLERGLVAALGGFGDLVVQGSSTGL